MKKELVISVFVRDTSWVDNVSKEVSIKKYRKGKNLNLDSFAKVSDTSPYDIITSVSERCERVYIN